MRVAILISAIWAGLGGAAADEHRESAFRGRRLAEANCATCHAIAQHDPSSMAEAPPLREIGERIPRETLRQLFRGRVFVEHAVMPDFEPDARQADDLARFVSGIAANR